MSQSKPLINQMTALRAAMEPALLNLISRTGELPAVYLEGATMSRNSGVKKAPTWTVSRKVKPKGRRNAK